MTILLSSYMVYNSVGVISEDNIQELGVIVQIGKHLFIQIHKSQGVGWQVLLPQFPLGAKGFRALTDEVRWL